MQAAARLAKPEPEPAVAAPAGQVLGPEFFNRDTVTVARDLLGKVLFREVKGERF
jgi:hypothetical protein